METAPLKRFAQRARRDLLEQVATRLELVLQPNSAARRENPAAIKQIDVQLAAIGKVQLIDKVAYTWFNRFCALRYMDVNRFNRIGVVSPVEGQVQPEILAEAKMGHMDADMVPAPLQGTVGDLLGGRATSADPQGEAYRLLVVAACNYWHTAMPFLFERIADYTELLMPDDLLSGSSILTNVRDAMTADACQDVEVIGWLYQFYISEKKDAVFDGMKKGKKITPANIPAATQLFTPHWIVRYLLENSLGRLWMLNHPDSKLVEQMEYYIRPEQAETDFLRIERPEDIKVCDPACGSGHMLTYAFDLLYAIYEEAGTDASEIPTKILTHNLYGIEIDERAGDLAAFALSMKARARQRRFFSKPIEPNICVLEKVSFSSDELDAYMGAVGRDLFTLDLRETLKQFEEADHFGSLIRPTLTNARDLLPLLEAKDLGSQLFLRATHDKVLKVLRQADYLSQKYQVVVANPPYMGSGSNARLSAWSKRNYPRSKADLFAMFIERNLELLISHGFVGMITMQSWMFLSSFEKLRNRLLSHDTILAMAHMGPRAFDSIGGEIVSTTAFVLKSGLEIDYRGSFIRLVDHNSEAHKENALREAIEQPNCSWNFSGSASDFKKIPGHPIAYWTSPAFLELFESGVKISEFIYSRDGLTTGENERFIRLWWEIDHSELARGCAKSDEFWATGKKWAPLIKGGAYRKWYGNSLSVITYDQQSYSILADSGNKLPSRDQYFKPNLSWTRISSPSGSFRFCPPGSVFESASLCAYSENERELFFALAAANSKITPTQLNLINPTVNLLSGYFDMVTLPRLSSEVIGVAADLAKQAVAIARTDWDANECSIDFEAPPLLGHRKLRLRDSYAALRDHQRGEYGKLAAIEEEINRIFIPAAKLDREVEVAPEIGDLTLTSNPRYRYGHKKTDAELEVLVSADTAREFVSYAVGCMFGRYSLDKPGLVLANQGETLADYLRQVPQPRFVPDADNVIPLLDGEWFNDDITERFRSFLRVTFGEPNYAENLKFVEDALGKDIRKFFLKDFYTDHTKRYKKRPIYWLFASPKGSFNALVYMHRYRPDTVSVVLQYLRDFQEKLTGERKRQEQVSISASASQADKTRALKSIDSLKKTLAELDDYERDVLHPLATQQIAIDLDDGVKVNYLKFGAALKKIPGLEAKDEE